MNTITNETPPIIYTKTAGLLYLIIIVFGIYSEVFIRGSLIVEGDSVTTATSILASENLFRFGLAADVIMILSDVAIAILFYILLKPVSKTLALMAAAFRLIQASILGFNLLNYYAALLLIKGTAYSNSFEAAQLQTLALLFLEIHSHGYDLGLIFFSFSSIILGVLLIRSDYFPHLFGYGLMAAGLAYLTGSFTRFLFPDYSSLIQPIYIIPLTVELSFCLWLLISGKKRGKVYRVPEKNLL